MFASYFDASGHSEDQNCPFVVVAGYIANINQWKALEIALNERLREHRISGPFHMVDFMARSKSTSPFHKWDGDDAEAEKLLKELTALAQLFPLASISCIVDLSEYREVEKTYDVRGTLPPFALGARTCMAHLYEGWLNVYGISSNEIECVFEDGDFGRGKFLDAMRADGMPAPIFKAKKDFAALQAADHLAWEHYHYLKKELANEHNPARISFRLLRWIPHITVHYPKANLIELCNFKGIKPKSI